MLRSLGLDQAKYMETLILIPPNQQLEFDVHIDASLWQWVQCWHGTQLVSMISLQYMPLNFSIKHNIIILLLKEKPQQWFNVLHKFRHFLLGNKFVFYVNHMALVYLVNKPQVSRRITRWLLLFLEYEFIVVYKPSRTHVVVDVLSRLPNSSKPLSVPNQIVDASLFFIEPIWMKEIKTHLETG